MYQSNGCRIKIDGDCKRCNLIRMTIWRRRNIRGIKNRNEIKNCVNPNVR